MFTRQILPGKEDSKKHSYQNAFFLQRKFFLYKDKKNVDEEFVVFIQ